METFKKALKDYFVFEGKDVLYIKNEKHRLREACAAEDCPWLIFTYWNSASRCFQVKTLIDEHTCARDYGSNMADRGWVASKLIKRLLIHPDLKPRQAIDHMIEEYNVQLNYRMIARALKVAREMVIGNAWAQYGKVRDYLSEIHQSNPRSTALMEIIPQPEALPLFDRLYISLNASNKSFIQSCRPLIGRDGYFLKGYYGRQLLSAVGQDANNNFFVIAYDVVPNECKDTWKWFLTLLQDDLGLVTQHGWNFISDQQKGLELAIKKVMPNAHHRNCVLHIWKNFIKHFKDQQTKQMVWEAARCTTFQEFNACMEKMKKINLGAWEYLQRFDPALWTKAYFSHGPKVDNITNNMCEVWNAKIIEYRGKPILTMCEDLRCYLMRKMATHKKKLESYSGQLAPVQQKKL
ncbi:uncharacterized protein LOC107484239 [Arachis duranensis]|uniref:Uncharacterized protein LOC107484239 n=1 Tax=Arachis duranensis TaxID=130453 RepID=A0A6P4D3G7_ARADU|nr:uncharacterized protein LOC107484239 [Arachis duranensis]